MKKTKLSGNLVKSIDQSDGEDIFIEGIMTAPVVDLDNEIIGKESYIKVSAIIKQRKKDGRPIPIMVEHRKKEWSLPVGSIEDAKPTDEGLWFRARIIGGCKGSYLDTVQRLIKAGALYSCSIGGDAQKSEQLYDAMAQKSIRKIIDWDIRELSLTGLPVNQEAFFTIAKSFAIKEKKSVWEKEVGQLYKSLDDAINKELKVERMQKSLNSLLDVTENLEKSVESNNMDDNEFIEKVKSALNDLAELIGINDIDSESSNDMSEDQSGGYQQSGESEGDLSGEEQQENMSENESQDENSDQIENEGEENENPVDMDQNEGTGEDEGDLNSEEQQEDVSENEGQDENSDGIEDEDEDESNENENPMNMDQNEDTSDENENEGNESESEDESSNENEVETEDMDMSDNVQDIEEKIKNIDEKLNRLMAILDKKSVKKSGGNGMKKEIEKSQEWVRGQQSTAPTGSDPSQGKMDHNGNNIGNPQSPMTVAVAGSPSGAPVVAETMGEHKDPNNTIGEESIAVAQAPSGSTTMASKHPHSIYKCSNKKCGTEFSKSENYEPNFCAICGTSVDRLIYVTPEEEAILKNLEIIEDLPADNTGWKVDEYKNDGPFIQDEHKKVEDRAGNDVADYASNDVIVVHGKKVDNYGNDAHEYDNLENFKKFLKGADNHFAQNQGNSQAYVGPTGNDNQISTAYTGHEERMTKSSDKEDIVKSIMEKLDENYGKRFDELSKSITEMDKSVKKSLTSDTTIAKSQGNDDDADRMLAKVFGF